MKGIICLGGIINHGGAVLTSTASSLLVPVKTSVTC